MAGKDGVIWGTIDHDNRIFIRGRSKTMILGASGQNIYPEEMNPN